MNRFHKNLLLSVCASILVTACNQSKDSPPVVVKDPPPSPPKVETPPPIKAQPGTDDTKQNPLPPIAGPNVRISIKEAQFIRETKFPQLGEAWRDPSGIVWGDVVLDEAGQFKNMKYKDAESYCKKLGARLPTDIETERLLRSYFGYVETGSYPNDTYNPFQKGTTEPVLPNWDTSKYIRFWTTTTKPWGGHGHEFYSTYTPPHGSLGVGPGDSSKDHPVYSRCIVEAGQNR